MLERNDSNNREQLWRQMRDEILDYILVQMGDPIRMQGVLYSNLSGK
jgi:hypothetical protein